MNAGTPAPARASSSLPAFLHTLFSHETSFCKTRVCVCVCEPSLIQFPIFSTNDTNIYPVAKNKNLEVTRDCSCMVLYSPRSIRHKVRLGSPSPLPLLRPGRHLLPPSTPCPVRTHHPRVSHGHLLNIKSDPSFSHSKLSKGLSSPWQGPNPLPSLRGPELLPLAHLGELVLQPPPCSSCKGLRPCNTRVRLVPNLCVVISPVPDCSCLSLPTAGASSPCRSLLQNLFPR